jgi:hypothetical protein
LALNLGFLAGEIDNPEHHDPWVLFAALIVGLITSGLKLGDRSPTRRAAGFFSGCISVCKYQLHLMRVVVQADRNPVPTTPIAKCLRETISESGRSIRSNC